MAVQQITAQLVGFVAMTLCIGCFQCKSKNMLLALQLAGNAVFILHYVLLGAYSGCASLGLLVGSNLMLLFRIKGKSWAQGWGWRWIFSILTVLVGIATWKNIFSLLPCAASVAFILTNWTCDGKVMRLGKLLLVGPGWIAYNIYVQSWSGIISEGIGMCSALIALCRYERRGRERPEKEAEPHE